MIVRWYRLLLGLLPSGFREEYGAEMARVVEEHWRAVRGRTGPWGAARFWARQAWAVIRTATALRLGSEVEGMSAAAGSVRPYRPERDDGTGAEIVDTLWQDTKHAVRSLAKRPGFTAVTVLTLGTGIGASTSIFSAVHAVLFRDLPYRDAERAVAVFHADAGTGERGDGVSAGNIADLAERSTRLSWAAVAEPWSLDLQLEGRTEALRTWAVSEGFFEAIGAEASLGRLFGPEAFGDGDGRVAVLGHRSWTTRFGSDPTIVGRTLTFEGEDYTVVGVLPEAFRYPDAAELWIPRQPRESDAGGERASDYMHGVARLAPGAGLEDARAEARRIAAGLVEEYPRLNTGIDFELVPLRAHLFGDVRTPLLVLFGAVGFVLLIACANVAGLMLARGAGREREFALRSALGASSRSLVRYLAVESIALAALGCLVGLGIAWGGLELIGRLGPDHLPRIDELRLDGAVLLFSVAAAAFSALASGLAPSLRFRSPDLRTALSEGTRGSTHGPGGNRLRNRLVVAEIAAAVVLLVGAGLLSRSFSLLLDEELGFAPENRLAVQVFAYGYESPEARSAFVNGTIETMEAIPGVEAVALTSNLPGATEGVIAAIDIDLPFVVEDRARPPEGHEPVAAISSVGPGYFDVMDIALVAGRGFERADGPDAPPVAMINEALARRHFGEQDPVGESLAIPWGGWAGREIVGVVADVRPLGHESAPRPEIYLPLTQNGSGSLTFVVKASGDPSALTRPAMEAIWQVNPSQSIWGAATLESLLGDWLRERRFNMLLLGAFAGIALLLAAVGIYGLVSYSVEERIQELGIRRALGGQSSDLLAMVLGQGAVLAGLGIALGIVGALVLGRFLRGMLFGIEPTDPLTFGVLGAAVLVVAAAAAFLPALRATRVDPMVALRNE